MASATSYEQEQEQEGYNPRAAYELNRGDADEVRSPGGATQEIHRPTMTTIIGDECSSAETENYLDLHTAAGDSTVITAANIYNNGDPENADDATSSIHEMHLALLYLLSHSEEFERAANTILQSTSLQQWNAEYGDNESLYTEAESTLGPPPTTHTSSVSPPKNPHDHRGANNTGTTTTPLPYAVFADDAEVVLPAAYSASQIFGVETATGMELEAAAGVPALSQLFCRWLALMPGGDHLNLIDPPGLTVMRIAGGRYRVTAAHKVVWTWMNEFPAVDHRTSIHTLQAGDLVAITIVDVFETDNQGKLLSYCPTFDNRAVHKVDRTAHALRKNAANVRSAMKQVQNSALATMIAKHASTLAGQLKQRVDHAVHTYNHGDTSPTNKEDMADAVHGAFHNHGSTVRPTSSLPVMYMGDDDTERHEI